MEQTFCIKFGRMIYSMNTQILMYVIKSNNTSPFKISYNENWSILFLKKVVIKIVIFHYFIQIMITTNAFINCNLCYSKTRQCILSKVRSIVEQIIVSWHKSQGLSNKYIYWSVITDFISNVIPYRSIKDNILPVLSSCEWWALSHSSKKMN